LKINRSKKLTILTQDTQGKGVTKFDAFQEKLIHLIVVSDDLQVFQHLHPKYQGNGLFTIDVTLPSPGPYRTHLISFAVVLAFQGGRHPVV
jgi:hypothetical protein